MIICELEKCTGCQACRASCSKGAISFQENEHGHIHPVIDESECTECGKCINVCPVNHPIKKYPAATIAYAGWIKDKKNRIYSTSGGLSYLLSKTIVEQNGAFCGVCWKNQKAEHAICEKKEDLHVFQGSKYTHSDLRDTFKEIKQLLQAERKILFTGTPCQVAGLRSYLHKDYPTLYTVDIVCHGIPSNRLLRDRIKSIENEHQKRIIDIRFRHKSPDQYTTNMKYTFEDNNCVMHSYSKDPFSRCFVENYALRINCFKCEYASLERVSDITLADFWGYIPKKIKYYSFRKGTSLIIVNSHKGQTLMNALKGLIVIEKRPISDAIKSNQNLSKSQQKPNDYEEFWHAYSSGNSLEKLAIQYYPPLPVNTSNLYIIKRNLKDLCKIIIPKTWLQYTMNSIHKKL